MAERLRVLYISRLFSPFHVEVGEALNRLGDVDYRIAFTMFSRDARQQPHWTKYTYDSSRYRVKPEGESAVEWLLSEIREHRPQVLVLGQAVGELYEAVLRCRSELRAPVGLWTEPPAFHRPLHERAMTKVAVRLRLAAVDFVLAIGDRAEAYYRANTDVPVRLVPYGADLSLCLNADGHERPTGTTLFLFSGQLQPHHNIPVMMAALARLDEAHPDRPFEFVLSATGPLQTVVDEAIRRSPRLSARIRYDTTFATWEDRLRPFRQCHVFVYPCSYTGWGLVIPEAMAAGMTVISSRYAEAARYFIRHRVNGIFIEPTVGELAREMEYCLDRPEMVAELGRRAREDARDGDATRIAVRMRDVLFEQHAAWSGREPLFTRRVKSLLRREA